MPELPEVETIRSELAPHLIGRRITGVNLTWEGSVKQPSPQDFRRRLTGQEITALGRRGKYLVFSLSGGDSLAIHLRMTGILLLKPPEAQPERYTRAVFQLDDGSQLFFNDMRKLGMLRLAEDAEGITGGLGPEPLEEDFTTQSLAGLLKGRKAPIKALLLDQHLLAGVGNMYADEALFSAGIHPLRAGGNLNKGEIERLHRAVREVLRKAIANKGASIDSYLRPDGTPGTAHDEFRVAHKRNQPCPRCSTTIQRISIRNRGSYHCPKCQPLR